MSYFYFQNSLGKSNTKKIMHITPILPIKKADRFIYSLQNLYEKRAQVNKLFFYRSNHGITTNRDITLVEKNKNRYYKRERVELCKMFSRSTVKKNRPPLQIFHLPR